MKSTKSKVLAAVLAASILMTACSSNTGKDVSGEDVTDSMSEEVTTETTEEVPEGDEIIPLYKPEFEDEIREVSPYDLLYFDTFSYYFSVSPAKTDDSGRTLYQLDQFKTFDLKYDSESLATGYSLEGADPDTTTNVGVYFSGFNMLRYTQVYGECDGKTDNMEGTGSFIPLFYNQTRACLVGYNIVSNSGKTEVHLREVYHGYISMLNFEHKDGMTPDVDNPEEYGFTTIPDADTPTRDVIIPLYKPEFEAEIRKVSPAELYEFDNYSKYFPVETISEEGLTYYKLKADSVFQVRDVYNDTNTENKTLYGVEYYAYGRPGDVLGGMVITEDKSVLDLGDLSGYYDISKGHAFVPILYNQTRNCLVGYVPEESVQAFSDSELTSYDGYYLIEVYYGSMMPGMDVFPAYNPGRYGF